MRTVAYFAITQSCSCGRDLDASVMYGSISCQVWAPCDGNGVWISDGDRVKGKWVELTADRGPHKFAGRGEITFELRVHGDIFTGTETARFYDTSDKLVGDPLASTLKGTRVRM